MYLTTCVDRSCVACRFGKKSYGKSDKPTSMRNITEDSSKGK
jgi:hypothetical protein